MRETGCSPVETEAIGYIAAYYPADAAWVENGVNHHLKSYNGENAQDIIHSLVNEAHRVAQNPGHSLDKTPESLAHFHLPSHMAVITEIETRLGVVDKQFTVADQLDILTEAERVIRVKNKRKLEIDKMNLATEPASELRDQHEKQLLTAEIEDSDRKRRIKEMTGFVTTLRLGPAAAPVANDQQTYPEFRL